MTAVDSNALDPIKVQFDIWHAMNRIHCGEVSEEWLDEWACAVNNEVVQPLLKRQAAELAKVRASRKAWAIEADRLDVIATAARYFIQPDTCDGSDCDHDDEVCVHMEERHATAAKVSWLETEREKLIEICAAYGDFTLDVAEALGLPANTSNDDLIAALSQLQPFAAANGQNACFCGDHFEEIEDANRVALGEHHRSGHTVAELITKLVQRYNIANKSREKAWGQLAEVGKLLGVEDYDVGEVLPLIELYLDRVKLVTDQLTQERNEARDSYWEVKETLESLKAERGVE